MIELKGFYNEDTLQKLLYKGNITQLEYIYHHSQEKIDAYKAYCEECGMKPFSQRMFVTNLMASYSAVTKGVDKTGRRRTIKGVKLMEILT